MPTSTTRLSRVEKSGLAMLLVVVILFGALVELRSAYLSRRMGDLGCYLRAAWAVRLGDDLYAATDDNGWHYNYPPLLAILLVPLADPPTEVSASWVIPYPVSVALWYLCNLLCLALGVHCVARALERLSPDPAVRAQPAGCRRWWMLRLLPLLACLTPIGHTLMRGQINLVVLALLAAMTANLLGGRSLRAGICLAGATCLKVIPGFLVVYFLWKRDWRGLGGFGAGMLAGIVLIPALVFGPSRTVAVYETWKRVMLEPALVGGPDESRARELLAASGSYSQSLVSTLHNALHPDPDARPRYPAPWLKLACWCIGGVLTLATLRRAQRRRRIDAGDAALVLGALTMIMLLLSPVCHRHYYCLQLPLVIAFIARTWDRMGGVGVDRGLLLILTLNFFAQTISHIPGCEDLRNAGLGAGAALLLWLTALLRLRRDPRHEAHHLVPLPSFAA